MKKQHRFSIWYAIIGMWVVLFLHNMIAGSLSVKNIPYSEFVKAVKEYGMSERVGQVYFANKQRPAFLGAMGDTGGQYSDETAKTIDAEVRRIIENQYDVALTILKTNRDLLVATVGQLLKDEVIEGDALIDLAGSLSLGKSMDDSTKTGSTQRAMAA